jgi:hypothetical protein
MNSQRTLQQSPGCAGIVKRQTMDGRINQHPPLAFRP